MPEKMAPLRRILITGGSGFIGTNLVEYWRRQGAEVLNLDQHAPVHPDHGANWQALDIRHKEAYVGAATGFRPDVFFHLAARADLDGKTVADYDANTVGVENTVAAAKASGAERVIFLSSQLVCTPGYRPKTDEDYCPPNPYGESKVIGEQIVRTMSSSTAGDAFAWTLVRPTSLWGPWFRQPYREFFDRVRHGSYVEARHVRVHKSFGYVGNAAFQLDRLASCPPEQIHGRVLYLADYEPVLVSGWADMIRRAWGAPPIRQVPLPLLRAAAVAGDVLKQAGVKGFPITSYRLRNLLTDTPQDMEPLRRICGDLPYTQQEGTDATVAWMKAQESGTQEATE